MKLKEINMNDKFTIIINANYDNGDYITKVSTFNDNEFVKISSLITIIQDIYDKKEDIQEILQNDSSISKQNMDIRMNLDTYIETYFKHYFNIDILSINKNALSLILNASYDFIQNTNNENYNYPNSISEMKIIIRDIYEISFVPRIKVFEICNPDEDDIKISVECIIDWLKTI